MEKEEQNMKLFLTILLDVMLGALLTFTAAVLSKLLAQEKNTVCYIGMVAIDVIMVATICVAWLNLMGVI